MERVLSNTEQENQFLAYAEKFLSITQQLTSLGKRDVVFVSLQKLARQGFLTKVISLAQSTAPDRYRSFIDQITQVFNEEGLVEFIDILS